jgi:hypothetical protein
MSALKIQLEPSLGLYPPVIGYLANVGEYQYGYREFGLRHPGGIFNSQFSRVTSDLLDLVKHVEQIKLPDPTKSVDNRELDRKFTGTLFSFANYYESVYEIILGCCPYKGNKPEKEIWKWLKENGYSGGITYRSNLSEASFFLSLFNELKHSSCRFGYVFLRHQDAGTPILGYYAEAVADTGAIIPHPELHPGAEDRPYCANSFNRDLRRLFYCVYKIADVLADVLKDHFQSVHSTSISVLERKESDAVAKELLNKISSLPNEFLPNEHSLSVPLPRVTTREAAQFLLFEKSTIGKATGPFHVLAMLPPGDGFSRSWGLPYTKITPRNKS